MREPRAPVDVVASTGIAALLAGPPRSGHVLGVGAAAAYLVFPPTSGAPASRQAPVPVVAVEAHGAVGLPLAVDLPASAGTRLAALRPRAAARIGDGRLVVGGGGMRVARWRDPRPSLAATRADGLRDRAGRAAAQVPAADDPLDRALAGHARDLSDAGRHADASAALRVADAMLGLGSGSTPGGDDVLAGFVAAGRLLAPAIHAWAGPDADWFGRLGTRIAARAAAHTPALSAALLWHAAHGQVVTPAAALLRALTGHGDVPRAMAGLCAIGHTSGAHLARGILAAAVLATDLDPSHATAREHHARTPGGPPRGLPRFRQPDAGQPAGR